MNKILITDIGNSLGHAIASYLHSQRYDVLGLIKEYEKNCKFPIALCNPSQEFYFQNKFDFIIYTTGYLPFPQAILSSESSVDPGHDTTNALKNVIQFARAHNSRIIHISTTQVYGEPSEKMITETSPSSNPNAYGLLKHMEETLLQEAEGIRYISLRIPEVSAVGLKEGWMAEVVEKALQNEEIAVSSLDSIENFVWMDDLTCFIEQLIEMPNWPYDAVHLVSHQKASTRELLLEIGNLSGSDSQIVVYDHIRPMPLCLDDSRALEMEYSSVGTLEMARRMLPKSMTRQLGKFRVALEDMKNTEKTIQDLHKYLMLFPQTSPKKVDKNFYETFYKMLKRKYTSIVFDTFWMTGISYMCYHLYAYAFEHHLWDKNTLHVLLPVLNAFDLNTVPNRWLFQRCAEMTDMVTDETSGFWKYVVSNHKDEVRFSSNYFVWSVIEREMDYRHRPFPKDFILGFSQKDESEAKKSLRSMGLDGKKYICFYARDNAWNKKGKEKNRDPLLEAHDASRNSNIENYRPAVRLLSERGICSVRMGAAVERPFSEKGAVDYAWKYRTEMMDFYLLAHCRFFVFTSAGIFSLAMLFRTPMVLVNSTTITQNMDNVPPMTPQRDLLIPKKFWNKKESRYLALREILAFEQEHGDYDIFQQYQDHGIELHENTPEEIADVIMEMEDRLEGKRFYTQEETALQTRYREILMESIEKSHFHWMDARLGTDFLKKNSWFLE